jgi:uncharacterized protein
MKRKIEEDNEPNKRPKITNAIYLSNHNSQALQTEGFSLSLLKSSPNFTKEPFMINGKIFEGTKTTYFEDGTVESTCEYKNYKKNGLYVKYEKLKRTYEIFEFSIDEVIRENDRYKKISCYYKNDELHGNCIEYYDNGKIKIECEYYEDIIHGKYSNGGKYETNFKHGKMHGLNYRSAYDNHEIREYYEDDLLHGTKTECFSNGNPYKIEEYVKGKLNGTCSEYFESGGIRSVKEYKNGKQHGKCTLYYEDGKIRTENNYVKGWQINN